MNTGNRPIRLLLIEDDELTREVLTLQIEAEGYVLETADSGDAALRQLKETAQLPETVLTDLQMPGVSGLELARELRSLASAAGVEGMVLLAMSASHPGRELLAAYDGFLAKPFTMEQLAVALAGEGGRALESQQGDSGEELAADVPSLDETIYLDETTYGRLKTSLPAAQLQELYALCISDAQTRIERMRVAGASGDDATFHAEAHAIKGSSSMVGAIELQRLAAAAETFGIQHANYVVSLDEMLKACERLRSMLVAHEHRAI
ncbi:response regulator [Granulicella sp. dw_53]|uniref:response regulator n=1 Tax=Granulicella sp. dw_53 TaxID=2719792 RepID=UPI001BD288BE|nr:response regulator [Granulicella sp. dw_53]